MGIMKKVTAQEIKDKSVTVSRKFPDGDKTIEIYYAYVASPNKDKTDKIWKSFFKYDANKVLKDVQGDIIADDYAVAEVNSAIDQAKTYPNIKVLWGGGELFGSVNSQQKLRGKRTCAPKKNLAKTFDKNFKKML